MRASDALARLHEAIGDVLDEDEAAIAWTLTIDAAGPDGERYLAHRTGTGPDGTVPLPCWVALGMLRASTERADATLQHQTAQVAAAEDAFPPTFG